MAATVKELADGKLLESQDEDGYGERRQQKGLASTEDLRLAMIHYRTLFAELVGEQSAA